MISELPEGWKTIKIEDIAAVNSGQGAPQGDNWYDGKNIFVKAGDLNKLSDQKYVGDYCLNVMDEAVDKYKLRIFPKNSIVFPKSGMSVKTDNIALLKYDSYVVNHLAVLEINDLDSCDPFFLYYFLKRVKISNISLNESYPSIRLTDISRFKVILPLIESQKKIVEILEKAEKLKEWREEADELADEYLKSAFISIFGDSGKNPNDWEQKTLGEVCHTIKDGPHVSPKYVEDGIPFISVNNIIKGYWDLKNVRYVSYEDHQKFTKKCKPEKGDVLYTKGGTTGFAKYIDIDLEFSNWVHLAVLKFDKKEINGIFLEHMLNSDYCFKQSQLFTRGIANRDLVINQMKRIKIFVPPITLQNQFASIAQQVEALKSYQSESKQEIDNLFNTLMQKAFKGELVC